MVIGLTVRMFSISLCAPACVSVLCVCMSMYVDLSLGLGERSLNIQNPSPRSTVQNLAESLDAGLKNLCQQAHPC